MFNITQTPTLQKLFRKSAFYHAYNSINIIPETRKWEVIIFKNTDSIGTFGLTNWNVFETFCYALFLNHILNPEEESVYIFLVNRFQDTPATINTPSSYTGFMILNGTLNIPSKDDLISMININNKQKRKITSCKELLPHLKDKVSTPLLYAPDLPEDTTDCYILVKNKIGTWTESFLKEFKLVDEASNYSEFLINKIGELYVRWLQIAKEDNPVKMFEWASEPRQDCVECIFSSIGEWFEFYYEYFQVHCEDEIEVDTDDPVETIFINLILCWALTHDQDLVSELIIHKDLSVVDDKIKDMLYPWLLDLINRIEDCHPYVFCKISEKYTLALIEDEKKQDLEDEATIIKFESVAQDIVNTFFSEFSKKKITKSNKAFNKALKERLPLLSKDDLTALSVVGLPLNMSESLYEYIDSIIENELSKHEKS